VRAGSSVGALVGLGSGVGTSVGGSVGTAVGTAAWVWRIASCTASAEGAQAAASITNTRKKHPFFIISTPKGLLISYHVLKRKLLAEKLTKSEEYGI